MRSDRKWTILDIRETQVEANTTFQFFLNHDVSDIKMNISLDQLHNMMAKFKANQLHAKELSGYITDLVPTAIQKRLKALGKKRLYLGIRTSHDQNADHPFPFHAIPWEAAYADKEGGETWAVAYSAVRIADGGVGITGAGVVRTSDGAVTPKSRKPDRIGLFCCEYHPPLAQRDALRNVLETASRRKLDEVREVTESTAARDFLDLQRCSLFYASCHGEKFEYRPGKSTIGLVKPGYTGGPDSYFLLVELDDGSLNSAGLLLDPPPPVFCLDACFSASDQRVPEYVISRGCNVFIGNAFEAIQDSQKNGTPAVREIMTQILMETFGKRKCIGSCISAGRQSVKDMKIYQTLVYVSNLLAPDKDAFGCEGAVGLPRWFLLLLLAVVSLFVSIVIGKAFVFRFLLTQTTLFLRFLCDAGIGAVLFLIGLPTVPKNT